MTKPFEDQEEDFTYDKDFFDEFFSEDESPQISQEKTIEEKTDESVVEFAEEKQEELIVESAEEKQEEFVVESVEEKQEEVSVETGKEPQEILMALPVEKAEKTIGSIVDEKPEIKPKKRTEEKTIDVPITYAKKRFRGLTVPIVAIVLCMIAACVAFVFYNEHMTYASVYLSINPTVRIDVNKKDIVIDAEGVNADGTAMLDNYNYKNKTIETVIDELIDLAMDMGYLKEGGTIKLTLDSSHSDWIQNHRESLNKQVNKHLSDASSNMNIQIDMEEAGSDMSSESGSLNEDHTDDRNHTNNNDNGIDGTNPSDDNQTPDDNNNAVDDDRDDASTAGNTTNNDSDHNASDNSTTDEDTAGDNTTEENTSVDNTEDDNISGDNTTDDNTSADNATEDNTAGDNDTDEDTTVEDNTGSEDESDSSDPGLDVDGGMVIVPNSTDELDDSTTDNNTTEEINLID